MNIDPLSAGSDLPTDEQVDAIHDAVVITGFGEPKWRTRHFVGIILALVQRARSSGQSDDVTRPVVVAILDQLVTNVVLTPGETETWEAIKHRMVDAAYKAKATDETKGVE